MLSQTTEYALRAVVFLAEHAHSPQTSDQISQVTKVPAAYLAKVLQNLSRAHLVRSQRGVKGGFSLARPAANLTLLEVVNAVEPIRRIRSCPLELETHGTHLCPLHRRLDDALAGVERAFGDTTLENILGEPSTSVPLCQFPAIKPPPRPERRSSSTPPPPKED